MSKRLLDHLGAWDGTVTQPRPAATVVVLRPGSTGLEVFLMRRQSTMAFAAGMYVFPGGRVQDSDGHEDIPWVGPGAERWAAAFGCEEQSARANVVAAVRETFEETGVLLAGRDAAHVLSAAESHDLESARESLERGDLSMGDFLVTERLSIRADLLGPWAHWITPEFEPRRYDTRFFLAMLPGDQSVGTLASEAERGEWIPLREAHRRGKAGEIEMMPPTIHTIGQILAAGTEDLLRTAWRRPFATIAPRVVEVDGRPWLDGPDEDEL